MRVLLTNDDGIEAAGLQALRKALLRLPGIELAVIAPDGNRSAMARSITTRRPLWVQEVEFGDGTVGYATDGTPAYYWFRWLHNEWKTALGVKPSALDAGAIPVGRTVSDGHTTSGSTTVTSERHGSAPADRICSCCPRASQRRASAARRVCIILPCSSRHASSWRDRCAAWSKPTRSCRASRITA